MFGLSKSAFNVARPFSTLIGKLLTLFSGESSGKRYLALGQKFVEQ